MGSGMTKKTGSSKCGTWQVQVFFTKETMQTFYTGYAESEDGKYWTKPVLDIWNQTNIVDTCNRDAATIWLDKQEKDPSKRYKMFNVERRPTDRRWQFILKYSSDGIHWGEGVAQSGDLYDRSSASTIRSVSVGIEYALRDNSFFPLTQLFGK